MSLQIQILERLDIMNCKRKRLGLLEDACRWLGQGFQRQRMRMKMSLRKHGNPRRRGKHGHFQVNPPHLL